ncbi:MAG TPA: hypothetical protein VFW27_39765 [Actinoplanes sp.]|nr:hypothetical protein [Actinoplanes sp.]
MPDRQLSDGRYELASPLARGGMGEIWLGRDIGRDMLTRRQLFADTVQIALGGTLTDPLLRWLDAPTIGLPPRNESSVTTLTMSTVTGIEQATARFGAEDATLGGGLSREAAVGQLKYAVDLLRDAAYTDEVGNRALAAVAELAGMVGWMSHDVRMDGPAQRYFILGLQAAKESTDPRALLLRVSLLADMARQMRALDQPATGLRLVNAGLELLPQGRHPAAAAMLWNLKARMLGALGPGNVRELQHSVTLATDLLADASPDTDADLLAYTGAAELAGNAALAWQDAATYNADLARHAEQEALAALVARPDGYSRSRVAGNRPQQTGELASRAASATSYPAQPQSPDGPRPQSAPRTSRPRPSHPRRAAPPAASSPQEA